MDEGIVEHDSRASRTAGLGEASHRRQERILRVGATPLQDPVQRAAARARASTRRVTAGSSTSGGAWCGLIRASITSGPRQPQCLCSVKAPTPSMSAAGFERVKVTQRKLLERAGGELAVVDQHDQRERVDRRRRRRARAQKRASRVGVPVGPGAARAPARRARPGRQTRGSRSRRAAQRRRAARVGSVRRGGPAAAITTFEPWFRPWPE